jgi:Zn-dependent protease with chaperone function
MKTLHKKVSHLRPHNWKDSGAIGSLLLNVVFFVFLLILSALVSVIVAVTGFIGVALAYLSSPFFALLSLRRQTPKMD